MEFAGNLLQERVDSVHNDFTHQVVSIFQKEQGLEEHGSLGQKTAEAFNRLLRELGLPDEPSAPQALGVSGQVRREDGQPLMDTTVRAFHVVRQVTVRLGEDVADADGRYTTRYETLPLKPVARRKASSCGTGCLWVCDLV